MATVTYVFPVINDLDLTDVKSIFLVEESTTHLLPTFITLVTASNSLIINPTLMTQV
jgi:hypothetical protein